jgi:hypothetical protein
MTVSRSYFFFHRNGNGKPGDFQAVPESYLWESFLPPAIKRFLHQEIGIFAQNKFYDRHIHTQSGIYVEIVDISSYCFL